MEEQEGQTQGPKGKLVLPGEHLSSYEEAEPGQNCYADKDEVYAAAVGESSVKEGRMTIATKGRLLETPTPGMEVYCNVFKASLNNGLLTCVPVSEIDGKGRSLSFDAVLPVSAIRKGYVEDLRQEVKIGDIIKARVETVTRTGVEVSIMGSKYGVIKAFCSRCRHTMALGADYLFVCDSCGWKDRRKIPQPVGAPEEVGEGKRERDGFDGRGDRSGYGGERGDYGGGSRKRGGFGGERRSYGGERTGGYGSRPRREGGYGGGRERSGYGGGERSGGYGYGASPESSGHPSHGSSRPSYGGVGRRPDRRGPRRFGGRSNSSGSGSSTYSSTATSTSSGDS